MFIIVTLRSVQGKVCAITSVIAPPQTPTGGDRAKDKQCQVNANVGLKEAFSRSFCLNV